MKCIQCGKRLTGRQQNYCSVSCKKKYKYKIKTQQKKCKVCGKFFVGKSGESCCSSECVVKAQKIHTKVCPMCSKKFKGRGNGVYCSTICYRTANSETKGLMVSYCRVCGQSFRTRKDNPVVVCGEECSSKLFSTYIKETLLNVFGTEDKETIRKYFER